MTAAERAAKFRRRRLRTILAAKDTLPDYANV